METSDDAQTDSLGDIHERDCIPYRSLPQKRNAEEHVRMLAKLWDLGINCRGKHQGGMVIQHEP